MVGTVRLRANDREMALASIQQHPAVNVFIASKILQASGGQLVEGQLFATSDFNPAFLYIGGNAVPANFDPVAHPTAARGFAQILMEENPPIGSIVGPKIAVDAIWKELAPYWPITERLHRNSQPYLVSATRYEVPIERVRFANIADLSEYFEASLDMFKTEVETTPPLVSFQSRIAVSLQNETSLGWFDSNGKVLFKVDLGAMANDYLQLQGIWLDPKLRGQGLAAGLLAEAATLIQRRFDVQLCLYVNDFNLPAIATYRKLGFQQVETFSTVFF